MTFLLSSTRAKGIVVSQVTHPTTILFGIFVTRLAMAFQFQCVPLLGAELRTAFNFDFQTIGLLTGVYMLPGALLSTSVGRASIRFGDRSSLLFGLSLMVAGGVVCALASGKSIFVIGRVIAAVGAVVPFVLMSKIITDTFSGPRLMSAMSTSMTGWPFGIATAITSLGLFAHPHHWRWGFAASSALSLVGMFLLVRLPTSSTGVAGRHIQLQPLSGVLYWAIVMAGLVCTFYNSAFVIIHTYLPLVLRERGMAAAEAGIVVSLITWLAIFSMPLGGLIADKIQRVVIFITVAVIASIVAIGAAGLPNSTVLGVIVLGIVGSSAAGFIPALCSQVAPPERRAEAFAIFYTVFYIGMALLPILAGWMTDYWQARSAGIISAMGAMLMALPALMLYSFLLRSLEPPAAIR